MLGDAAHRSGLQLFAAFAEGLDPCDLAPIDQHDGSVACHHIARHAKHALGEGCWHLPEMRDDERRSRRIEHHEIAARGNAFPVDPERPVGERLARIDEQRMIVAPGSERRAARKAQAEASDRQPAPGMARGFTGRGHCLPLP